MNVNMPGLGVGEPHDLTATKAALAEVRLGNPEQAKANQLEAEPTPSSCAR